MVELTLKGSAVLDDYLGRVRAALAGSDLEIEQVVEDIRAHVFEALAEHQQPSGEAAVHEVLSRLGEPESWIRDLEPTRGRDDSGSEDGRLVWQSTGVFALTVIGIAAFPWVGPLILMFAWITARAVLATGGSAGSRELRWLLYPAIVLFVGFVVLTVALLPAFPLSEIAVALNFGPPVLLTVAGLLCWWVVLGVVARRARPVVVWFARPLLGE